MAIANGGNGMTTRHLFYRAVAAGIVDKSEAEYDGTVARLAVELRRSGDIPFGKIIDGFAPIYRARHLCGIKDALSDTASFYRRSYWRTADHQLEVWCEKDAIRALIQKTTWALACLIQRIAAIRKPQLYNALNPRIDPVSRPPHPPDRREFRYVRTVCAQKPPAVRLSRH
jgi:hypothetical protein